MHGDVERDYVRYVDGVFRKLLARKIEASDFHAARAQPCRRRGQPEWLAAPGKRRNQKDIHRSSRRNDLLLGKYGTWREQLQTHMNAVIRLNPCLASQRNSFASVIEYVALKWPQPEIAATAFVEVANEDLYRKITPFFRDPNFGRFRFSRNSFRPSNSRPVASCR